MSDTSEPLPEHHLAASHSTGDEEYVQHINNTLQCKMARQGLTDVEYCVFGRIIQPRLRDFMMTRAVDAAEWMLMCGAGEMLFVQTKEDEIPILCRYYNEFITRSAWSDNDHTMMTVLNKYDQIKAGGYGNFALQGAPPPLTPVTRE